MTLPIEPVLLHPSLPPFSRLVYGAWRLADAADTSPAHVRAKIHACLDQGITSVDHADIYGDYRCETVFGDALRSDPALAQRLQIITKCDIMLLSSHYPARRVKHYDTSPAHITASVERSLQRLGVERIDLLLLHRPDPLMDAEATGACLDGLIDSGKIGAAGASNFRRWDWDLLQSRMRHPLVTNQIEMSLLERSAFVDGSLAHLQQQRLRAMAWSPLGGGRLMGGEPAAQRLRPLLDRLAAEQGVAPESVALAWLLVHPAGVLPVVGTNQLERIRRLHEAMRVVLDRETWFELWTQAEGREVP